MKHRTIGFAAAVVGLAVALTGCSLSMRAVRFEGTPADWNSLAGEWSGEYTMSAYDRHGLIAFKLVPSAEAASGDVLMISDRFDAPYQRYPADPATRQHPPDRTQLLTIRFVRADAGSIAGRMDPYWDPDRGCEAVASFLGSVDGDTISGTVTSTCVDDVRGAISGRWQAKRQPVESSIQQHQF